MVNKNLTKTTLKKKLIITQLLMILSIKFGIQNAYPVNMPVSLQQQHILSQNVRPINQVQQPSTTFIVQNRVLDQKNLIKP
jgi:hypothetical protein